LQRIWKEDRFLDNGGHVFDLPEPRFKSILTGKLCSASPKWLAGVAIETVVSHLVSLRLLSIASELHPI
jgi:hypothetical protein